MKVYVNINTADSPEWRPATVTQDFGTCINATVHLDPANDVRMDRCGGVNVLDNATAYITSGSMGSGPGQWRLIPPRAA